jgi:hypothetical protein
MLTCVPGELRHYRKAFGRDAAGNGEDKGVYAATGCGRRHNLTLDEMKQFLCRVTSLAVADVSGKEVGC